MCVDTVVAGDENPGMVHLSKMAGSGSRRGSIRVEFQDADSLSIIVFSGFRILAFASCIMSALWQM